MVEVVICNDDIACVDIIKEEVTKFFNNIDVKCNISVVFNETEVLEKHNKYDIIFLDISENGVDGITIARKIRDFGNSVPIVFVTNDTQYWHSAYKVHAFDYMSKPIERGDIHRLLDDFTKLNYSKSHKKVVFKIKNKEIFLAPEEIMYFLVRDKGNIEICTTRTKLEIKNYTLKDILNKLEDKRFFMCHRSCIVNLDYVDSLEKEYDVIMKNGEFCPLSQSRKIEFMDYLSNIIEM